jgi:hypothetical protein
MKKNIIALFVDSYNELSKKNKKYIHNKKYSIETYFKEILNFFNNSIYWSRYNGIINGKTLNNKHNEFCKLGVYEKVYKDILMKYYKKCKAFKLKYQSIDSLFIKNKLCIMKASHNKNIGRNKFYKNKRGLKISSIVDSFGIPFSVNVFYGNSNDAILFNDTFNNILIDTQTNTYNKNNKYKQYFLGDKAYDTNDIRNTLKNDNLTTIIDYNHRRTKDPAKFRYLTKTEKKHYNKRIKVENFFGILTQTPKMNMIVEKTITSYRGVLFCILCKILHKKISS